MAPFDTIFSILILAIPLAVAMPRYTETTSLQVTSLEASATGAHCGYGGWPHSCWKYCGETGQWCWIQPTVYCEKDRDCNPRAPCTSSCGRGKKGPDFKALGAPHDPPVAIQVTIEEPVANADEAVNPSDHFSSVSADAHSRQVTFPEKSATDAHCGYGGWPHSCWRYCGEKGQWCWIQPTIYCEKDGDCNSRAPCTSSCGRGKKGPDFEVGNPSILVKLLIG